MDVFTSAIQSCIARWPAQPAPALRVCSVFSEGLDPLACLRWGGLCTDGIEHCQVCAEGELRRFQKDGSRLMTTPNFVQKCEDCLAADILCAEGVLDSVGNLVDRCQPFLALIRVHGKTLAAKEFYTRDGYSVSVLEVENCGLGLSCEPDVFVVMSKLPGTSTEVEQIFKNMWQSLRDASKGLVPVWPFFQEGEAEKNCFEAPDLVARKLKTKKKKSEEQPEEATQAADGEPQAADGEQDAKFDKLVARAKSRRVLPLQWSAPAKPPKTMKKILKHFGGGKAGTRLSCFVMLQSMGRMHPGEWFLTEATAFERPSKRLS